MFLLNDFDAYLLDSDFWEKESHYASNIFSCKRKQYYQWINLEKSNPPTAGSVLKMKFGFACEWIFQQFLDYSLENKKTIFGKKLVRYEVGWKERYKIGGLIYPITCKLDFVLFFETEEEMAVEVKSSYGRGIEFLARDQRPNLDYLKQIFVYTKLTPFKSFFHPYFGRDNGYRIEFGVHKFGDQDSLRVNFRDSWSQYDFDFEGLISDLEFLEQSVKDRLEPKRDFLVAIKNGEIKDKFQCNKKEYKTDWQCNYCDWRDHCWKEEVIKYSDANNVCDFIEMESKRGV